MADRSAQIFLGMRREPLLRQGDETVREFGKPSSRHEIQQAERDRGVRDDVDERHLVEIGFRRAVSADGVANGVHDLVSPGQGHRSAKLKVIASAGRMPSGPLGRRTTVCQTARGSHAQPRSTALFATNVSTSR